MTGPGAELSASRPHVLLVAREAVGCVTRYRRVFLKNIMRRYGGAHQIVCRLRPAFPALTIARGTA